MADEVEWKCALALAAGQPLPLSFRSAPPPFSDHSPLPDLTAFLWLVHLYPQYVEAQAVLNSTLTLTVVACMTKKM